MLKQWQKGNTLEALLTFRTKVCIISIKAWQVDIVNSQWSAFFVPDHFPDSTDSALSN